MAKRIYIGGTAEYTAFNILTNGALCNFDDTGWTFNSNYTESQMADKTTITINSSVDTSATGTYPCYQVFPKISGNSNSTRKVLYCQAKVKGKNSNSSFPRVYLREYANGSSTATYNSNLSSIDGLSGANLNDEEWHTMSGRFQTYDASSGNYWDYDRIAFGIDRSNTPGDAMDIKELIVVNLTDAFGKGNEPSKTWCDQNISFFASSATYSFPEKAIRVKKGYIGVLNNGQSKARKIKKGYIGVNNVAQQFYSSGLTWDKYAVIVDEGYNEITGESTQYSPNAFYAGSSYTLSQSTGQFTVNCDTQIAKSSAGATDAVGKYFVAVDGSFPSASGTYTNNTLYLITEASYNWLTGLKITVTPYTSEYYHYTYQGSLVGTVYGNYLSAYPLDGIVGDYWYVFNNEIAALSISYSGTYADELVQMGDQAYRLVSLTGSGTFNIEQRVKADVWICGGGQGGYAYNHSSYPRHGGGGSYCQQSLGVQIQNLVATIGAASGGNTSVTGDISLSAMGGGKNTSGTSAAGYGGSGGGGGTNDHYGVGDGLPKIPFADTYFAYPYCDGGGGGGKARNNKGSYYNIYGGGNAGINGEDGLPGNPSARTAGTSGHYGGAGGSVSSTGYDGKNATGYGSAGGGGSYYDLIRDSGSENDWGGSGGSGYQGVCLIRIPLN